MTAVNYAVGRSAPRILRHVPGSWIPVPEAIAARHTRTVASVHSGAEQETTH